MLSVKDKPIWLDKYLIAWIKKELTNATPDKIVGFYVDHFIFRNEGYLEYLIHQYNLPAHDFLKLHQKLISLEVE